VDVTGLGLLVIAAAVPAALLAGRARRSTVGSGVLPEALAVVEIGARLAALAGAAAVAGSALPVGASTAPFAGLAAALAIGWSLRDLLPDLVGWFVLLGQHRIRRGRHVRGPDFGGRVERVGLLATTLGDRSGEHTAVPNRRFVGQPLTVADSAYAPVELTVPVPGVPPSVARRALREAVLLSPWLAPDPAPEIGADPTRPELWRVRATLIEPRFAEPFSGSFAERVQEVLSAGSTPAPRAE
jgi:small-conductance mechanosensitive channel